MRPKQEDAKDWLVWDLEDRPESSDIFTILWRHSTNRDDATQVSIAAEVEIQSNELRHHYLAWIYDLSQVIVAGKRVVDHLKIRPELSYWWFSALAQKFNLAANSGINDTFKLLALENILKAKMPNAIRLHTENVRLAYCLSLLCQEYGIRFSFNRPRFFERQHKLGKLPNGIMAVVYLLWYSVRTLRCTGNGHNAKLSGEIFFVDILVHLGEAARRSGYFESNYWTRLVERTRAWGLSCTWGHLFFRHGALQTPEDASALIQRFNRASSASEQHVLLESYFSFGVLFAAIKDILQLGKMASRVRGLIPPPIENSRLNPWLLHQAAWEDSLTGREAVLNCLRLVLFERLMQSLPYQKLGIYIAENQPWEMALIYAWRTEGHGKLVGVPHTAVRFWDLRYHNDTRTYDAHKNELTMPQPDVLATNGPLARSALLDGGYPEDRMRDVEALRFLHLQTAKHCRHHSAGKNFLCVLVLGDFDARTNSRLLAWLNKALTDLPAHTRCIVKPHPAFPLDESSLPKSGCSISTESIHDLLQECNVVFTSNTTSAAIDAFCAGVPVVQMMDGQAFDNSPLRGVRGIETVSSPERLAETLLRAEVIQVRPEDLFNFSPDFRGWRHLMDGFLHP